MYALCNELDVRNGNWDDGPDADALARMWIALYPEGKGTTPEERHWRITNANTGAVIYSLTAIDDNMAVTTDHRTGKCTVYRDFQYYDLGGEMPRTAVKANGIFNVIYHD